MLAIALTINSIKSELKEKVIDEYQVDSYILSIVTDDFLSRCFVTDTEFSIIEAPVQEESTDNSCPFVQIRYNKETHQLEITKSLISGRPVFYHINSKGEFFCSTHIRVLRQCGVAIEENTDALPEFFVYRVVMPPRTLYKNIYQLFPGSTLLIEKNNQGFYIKCIENYNPPYPGSVSCSESQAAEEATQFLSDSLYLLSSKKESLAVPLSGGLDSSILYKLCEKLYGPSNTYSTAYPFEKSDLNYEVIYAQSAAKAFGTSHTHHQVSHKEYLSGFIRAIASAEMPLHHMQSVLFFLLFESGIPQDKQIIINGDGADGIWGSHAQYQIQLSNHPFLRFIAKPMIRLNLIDKLIALADRIERGRNLVAAMNITRFKDLPLSNPDHLVWSTNSFGDKNWVRSYFHVTREDIIRAKYNIFKEYGDRSIADLYVLDDLYSDMLNTHVIWSKLGESQGRILFYPFAFHKLVDHASSLSWQLKCKRYKNILKHVASDIGVPKFIINRPKTGLGLKRHGWAKKEGPFERLIPIAAKVFPEGVIRKTQVSHEGTSEIFWSILNYAIWKRLCVLNEPVEALLSELNENMADVRRYHSS